MRIEAILFDADGVIQRRPVAWRDTLGEVLGFTGEPSDFLADLYAVEVSALEGQSDFTAALSNLLSLWNCNVTLDDALHAWTMIEVDTAIADTVRALRRGGIACHLATNQEPHRARYMSEALGYRDLFQEEFYSCRMGVMKPAVAYFRAILKAIEVPPSNVLFLDDHQVNVDAAREAGLHATVFNITAGRDGLLGTLQEFGVYVA